MTGPPNAELKKDSPPENSEDLPRIVRIIQEILRPGSALTSRMHTVVNILFVLTLIPIVMLGFVAGWSGHLMFFLFLLVGLAASTNWFFSLLPEGASEAEKVAAPATQPATEVPRGAASKSDTDTPAPSSKAVSGSATGATQRRANRRIEE